MAYPLNLADTLAVVGIINPATTANTARVSGAIAARAGVQYLAIFQWGDMPAETLDCGIQSVDSDGTSNAANISDLQATQLAAHATNNDNKQIVIAFDGTDLIASGKSHFRARMVTGGATGGPAGCVVVAVPRYGPAENMDLSSVVQIIK